MVFIATVLFRGLELPVQHTSPLPRIGIVQFNGISREVNVSKTWTDPAPLTFCTCTRRDSEDPMIECLAGPRMSIASLGE